MTRRRLRRCFSRRFVFFGYGGEPGGEGPDHGRIGEFAVHKFDAAGVEVQLDQTARNAEDVYTEAGLKSADGFTFVGRTSFFDGVRLGGAGGHQWPSRAAA